MKMKQLLRNLERCSTPDVVEVFKMDRKMAKQCFFVPAANE
jgi:hypothetical protein